MRDKKQKKLQKAEVRNMKKFIHNFNKEHNLEKLCLSPELLGKFRKCEKYLLAFFFLTLGVVFLFFLIDYLNNGRMSLFPLWLLLLPFCAFGLYFYCYFLPKARKDRNSKYRNFWNYWASSKDYEKRAKSIAKKHPKEKREILIKLAEIKQKSHYNIEFVGLLGLVLYILNYLFSLESIVVIVLVSIPVFFVIEKLKSEERATYSKFIEDLTWANYCEED